MQDRQALQASAEPSFWSAVAYRWFVKYNPLYLISAALVLVGIFLVSKGLARQEGGHSELWLTAITELYQAALIAAAALLYRRGYQRPALMLALLEVVYLADLTFQTGIAPYFERVGWLISLVWLVLSLLKIVVLVLVLRLRLSSAAMLLLIAGATSLAVLPQLLHARVLGDGSDKLLVLCLFGLTAAGLWSRARVESRDELTDWGKTVLRRASCASWIIWGCLLVGHAIWWSIDYQLRPVTGLAAGAVLLATFAIRREAAVWLLVAGVFTVVGLADPRWFHVTALMAATVLGLRAWRGTWSTAKNQATPASMEHPYRTPSGLSADEPARRSALLALPVTEARRSLVLCVASLYLSIWTLRWTDGPPPTHLLWLDLTLGAAMVAFAWRRGRALPALILAVVYGHLGFETGILRAPGSTLQWGGLVLAIGFLLLIVGVAINMVMGARARPSE